MRLIVLVPVLVAACAAVVVIHSTYGCAAATIDADAAPCHDSSANCVTTDRYDDAAEPNVAANRSHADAAATVASLKTATNTVAQVGLLEDQDVSALTASTHGPQS